MVACGGGGRPAAVRDHFRSQSPLSAILFPNRIDPRLWPGGTASLRRGGLRGPAEPDAGTTPVTQPHASESPWPQTLTGL
jgi:hypothetical protein